METGNLTYFRVVEQEKSEMKDAVAAFEKAIVSTMEVGANSRETAIRWLFEGETDIEHALSEHGILFAENGKYAQEVKEILGEL